MPGLVKRIKAVFTKVDKDPQPEAELPEIEPDIQMAKTEEKKEKKKLGASHQKAIDDQKEEQD